MAKTLKTSVPNSSTFLRFHTRQSEKKFGSRCLLVLDGFDEHALGQNEDVISIIENRKQPDCKIVTSRPHSTRDVEEHFYTIGRVEGFTHGTAKIKKYRIRVEDSTLACVVIGGSPGPNSFIFMQLSAKICKIIGQHIHFGSFRPTQQEPL